MTHSAAAGHANQEVFRDVRTTSGVLAACKRRFPAPFTDEAISDRVKRRVTRQNVAVSLGIECNHKRRRS